MGSPKAPGTLASSSMVTTVRLTSLRTRSAVITMPSSTGRSFQLRESSSPSVSRSSLAKGSKPSLQTSTV
jgi:hypothetical protein